MHCIKVGAAWYMAGRMCMLTWYMDELMGPFRFIDPSCHPNIMGLNVASTDRVLCCLGGGFMAK